MNEKVEQQGCPVCETARLAAQEHYEDLLKAAREYLRIQMETIYDECPYCGFKIKERDIGILYHPCSGRLVASLFGMPVEIRETISENEVYILNRRGKSFLIYNLAREET